MQGKYSLKIYESPTEYFFYYYYELYSHMTGNDVSDGNKRMLRVANWADSIQPISGVAGVYRNIKA